MVVVERKTEYDWRKNRWQPWNSEFVYLGTSIKRRMKERGGELWCKEEQLEVQGMYW